MRTPAPPGCPRCGGEMNRHAEKLLEGPYGGAPEHSYEDEEGFNPLLHGVVIQIYACPQCGKGEARPASH